MTAEIKPEVIERIQQLLAEGHSERAVARMTGASKSTVALVEQGKRGLHTRKRGPKPVL